MCVTNERYARHTRAVTHEKHAEYSSSSSSSTDYNTTVYNFLRYDRLPLSIQVIQPRKECVTISVISPLAQCSFQGDMCTTELGRLIQPFIADLNERQG